MTRSPEDEEDIAYEMDRELGRREDREIARRVEWLQDQRRRAEGDRGATSR